MPVLARCMRMFPLPPPRGHQNTAAFTCMFLRLHLLRGLCCPLSPSLPLEPWRGRSGPRASSPPLLFSSCVGAAPQSLLNVWWWKEMQLGVAGHDATYWSRATEMWVWNPCDLLTNMAPINVIILKSLKLFFKRLHSSNFICSVNGRKLIWLLTYSQLLLKKATLIFNVVKATLICTFQTIYYWWIQIKLKINE